MYDSWNNDRYKDINKDDKTLNLTHSKSNKSKKSKLIYNYHIGSYTSNAINSKTLVADFIDDHNPNNANKGKPIKKSMVSSYRSFTVVYY